MKFANRGDTMAASETFVSYTAALSHKERTLLQGLITARRADLFAARSEDARLRILRDFLEEAKEGMRAHKR
jgi:hypothetical protein